MALGKGFFTVEDAKAAMNPKTVKKVATRKMYKGKDITMTADEFNELASYLNADGSQLAE